MEDVELAMPSMPSAVSPSGSSLVLDTGVLSSRSESGASVSKRLTSLLAERSRDRGRTFFPCNITREAVLPLPYWQPLSVHLVTFADKF
ncbi:hypothetical protein V1504DRAFT_435754 [Lipomyces starkeyi]